MDWKELENSLRRMKINQKIDKESKYREVNQIPPYKSSGGRFKGKESFRVRIGRTNNVNIPLDLLKDVFTQVKQGNNYSKELLEQIVPGLTQSRPCYTQVIKKMLEAAGLQI